MKPIANHPEAPMAIREWIKAHGNRTTWVGVFSAVVVQTIVGVTAWGLMQPSAARFAWFGVYLILTLSVAINLLAILGNSALIITALNAQDLPNRKQRAESLLCWAKIKLVPGPCLWLVRSLGWISWVILVVGLVNASSPGWAITLVIIRVVVTVAFEAIAIGNLAVAKAVTLQDVQDMEAARLNGGVWPEPPAKSDLSSPERTFKAARWN